jgi:multiple sugar transport system substrate-binding protein
MQVRAVVLAAALMLTSSSVSAADLVVWWEKGFNPEEDQAIRDIIAAFENKTGRHVDLALLTDDDLPAKSLAAVAAGQPPDFLFGLDIGDFFGQWAFQGRLADLSNVLGPLEAKFDRDALTRVTLLDATTGQRSLYAVPMAYDTNHLHVWTSLLELGGLTLADVPEQWEAFWSFWCDTVQPAVRKATGRHDIYGIGLPMSVGAKANDTNTQFKQFRAAYEADYVTPDGHLIIDEPLVRDRLVKALDNYTMIYRKGCTPPASADWDDRGNNQAFLAQTVVMTPNPTLSVPNALRTTRLEDYKNTATIKWPASASGQPLAIVTATHEAAIFRDGGHEELAKEFVHLLINEGWLEHWLDFTGDRLLPPIPAVIDQPFWLNPSDPHRIRSALQFLTQPRVYGYDVASGNWRHRLVEAEGIWPKAVHRVVTADVTPKQAVDEAIARIKQIVSE